MATGALVLGGADGAAQADETINFRFSTYTPSSVRIAPGQSVTWTGEAGSTFDALAGHPLQFADPAIAPQADRSTSTTRTFASVGQFPFSCRLHAQFSMRGVVLVSANHLPVAHFSAPSSAAPGAAVGFDASGSGDADPGQSLTYAWDFDGDGATDHAAATPGASFAFAQPGTYAVRLTVSDDNAEPGVGPESASTTRSITIGSGPGKSGPSATDPGAGGAAGGQRGEDGDDPDLIGVRIAGSTRMSAVRTRGLVVRVSNTEAARATATLSVGSRVIGRATTRLRARGPRTMRIVLNRLGRSLIRRQKLVRAVLRVVLDDADATATTAHRRITLRR